MIDFEQKQEYIDFANAILGTRFTFNGDTTIITSCDQNGAPNAVAIYTKHSQYNCEISLATVGAGFGTKGFLRASFAYPFKQCKKSRVTVIVAENNYKSLSLTARLGFITEGRLKRWFGDKDGVIRRMLKEECKWLNI